VLSGTYSDRFVVDRAFRTLYGGIPGSYLLETALLGGAYTINWFLDTFCDASARPAQRQPLRSIGARPAAWRRRAAAGTLLEQRHEPLLGRFCQRHYRWLARLSPP
jgi:hypothetical protein